MSSSSFVALPLETRRKILFHCSKKDLLSLALCSKFCHDDAVPMIWGEVLVKWDNVVESEITNKAGNLKHTRKLLLRGNHRHPEKPKDLNLGLFLRHCNASVLTSLTLSQLVIPDAFEKICQLLSTLKEIKLSSVRGNYDFVPTLRQLVSADIDRSNIPGVSPVTDDLVKSICLNLKQLTYLRIREVSNLTGKSLEYIGEASQLKTLELEILGCKIDGDLFSKTISQLKNIVTLKLSCTNVNDGLFDHIGRNFEKLEVLNVCSTKITSRSFPVISTLYSLQFLELESSRGIKDRDLAFFCSATKVEVSEPWILRYIR